MKRWRDQIDAWLDEGREERKREKKKGAIPEVNEKGPKNETSTQHLLKKGTRINQNRAKIGPKGSQNEAKRDKKSQQRLQDDLGPPWGAIFRLRCPGQVPSWVPKSSQIHEKSDAKSR